MDAEILAIGSELVLGTTVDTNSAYIARQLAAMGVTLLRVTIVGDTRDHITAAMREALQRADIVVCTGGLGPTEDDLTREAAAHALGRPLEFRQVLLDQIAARFAAMQRTMSESNRVQAYVPEGARAIENPRGTAPAFLVEDEQGTLIVLPGVPNEMRFLVEQAVLPYLRDERGVRGTTLVRTFHIAAMGESVVGERIADLMQSDNPVVGISAKMGRCEIRVSASAETPDAAELLIAPVVEHLRQRFTGSLVGDETPVQQVVRLLTERGYTLALYEGNSTAPVYQALHDTPGGLDQVRGIMIHPLDEPADETAIVSLAQAGAARVGGQWTSDISLAVQALAHPDETGFTAVCVVLVTPKGEQQQTRRYDLNQPEGWGFVSNLALEMVRRFLLEQ